MDERLVVHVRCPAGVVRNDRELRPDFRRAWATAYVDVTVLLVQLVDRRLRMLDDRAEA
jgi:hypothetical protein